MSRPSKTCRFLEIDIKGDMVSLSLYLDVKEGENDKEPNDDTINIT